jgi:hypothetical protein
MLNEMDLLASVAEKSLTGIETSPNETVNDAIDRAAMFRLPVGFSVRDSDMTFTITGKLL